MDPLARLMLGSKDFVDITKTLLIQADIHSEGRLVMVQEGGQETFLRAPCALFFRRLLGVLFVLFVFLCFFTAVASTPNGCFSLFLFLTTVVLLFALKVDRSVAAKRSALSDICLAW